MKLSLPPLSPVVSMLLILLFTSVASGPSQAGGAFPCSEPRIFPGSVVNLVVLPFSTGTPNETLQFDYGDSNVFSDEATRRLSALIQADTLYSLRYPASLAVVHLLPVGVPCAIDDIEPVLSDQMRNGHGIVFLWGNFLVEDGDIYVRSYVKFLRKNREPYLGLTLPVHGRKANYRAKLPRQAFGLAPRRLVRGDLEQIFEAEQEARVIYSGATGSDYKGELPMTPEEGFAYSVTGVSDKSERMHIFPHEETGLPSGWLAARSKWPLREKMPELDFVDAIIGYLVARIIVEDEILIEFPVSRETALRQTLDQIDQSLRRFEASVLNGGVDGQGNDGRPEAVSPTDFDGRFELAQAKALQGLASLLYLEHVEPYLETPEDFAHDDLAGAAAGSLGVASRLAPYLADVRNIQAMSLTAQTELPSKQANKAIATWRTALSLDPSNQAIADNLAQFYEVLLWAGRADSVGATSADLEQRVQALR